ncbi:ATP-binding protein [Ideonella sp.]|uniref:ATP-binding protein n=1 Tax=Ideonella sp. TaxID=1929293 RepID=UPI002B48C5B9|nr:ATP-binding protein [Ideonella sp.]HJV68751.1 ATP-binding protein [Ideonella sp.]
MGPDTWLDDNNRYLAASLQWLRLKLRRLADSGAGAPPAPPAPLVAAAPVPEAAAGKRAWFAFGQATVAPAASPVNAAAGTSLPAIAPPPQALDEAAARRADAARCEPPPALLTLAQRLGLSDFEADTLLLCAAVELDPSIGSLIAAVPGAGSSGAPSFALALQLFDEPSWEALSPHRPLRYAYLLDVSQPGATPLTAAALRADERIVHYLKGLNAPDERLATLLQIDDPEADGPRLAPSQQAAAEQTVQQLQALDQQAGVPLVALLGRDAASKLDVARAVGAALGRHLYRLSLDTLPTARGDIEHLARLWQRECLLLPIALYLDADELDAAPAEVSGAFHAFVGRPLGLLFVGLREPPAKPLKNAIAVEIGRPTAAEQFAAWRGALQPLLGAGDAAQGAAALAGQFDLAQRDIDRAVRLASAGADGAGAGVFDRLWAACCLHTRPRLDQLAQRIDARATWADLVLSDETMQLLHRIAEQVRQRYRVQEEWGYARKMNRGLGISALFAGESGTGKTMAAEVIANELKLALYRIDLSAVVSKYIGETEKNLRRLFDAAEQGGAILLFDEADALFGKRSEVKDSHDRYANIEVNYLLQRMESFSGLAILATNMKSALDLAFMRRLRFVLNFPYPGPTERQRMWQQALPAAVPRAETIDFARLARFNFSGGNIHSAALNAAFEAAAQGRPVTQATLLAAVRRELRKLDKPVNEGEFR